MRRIQMPESVAAWTIQGGEGEVLPAQDPEHDGFERTLSLQIERLCRVSVPGPFDLQEFNRIVLGVQIEQRQSVSIEIRRDDEVVVATPAQRVEAAPGRRVLLFDVPELGLLEEPFDEITLVFRRPASPVLIDWIDLYRRPSHAFLPPHDSPDLVLVGREHRRAVGLITGQPLESSLSARSGAELCFSYVLYGSAVEAQPPPRLNVTLEGARGVLQSHQLELAGPDVSGAWNFVSIGLEEFGRRDVTVRWAIEGAQTEDLACVLSSPYVRQRGSRGPIVLLITSDTHRADHVGASGSAVDVLTPAIDALAARGILFEDCFSSTNITNPSHMALMTGTHPRDIGVLNNEALMGDAAPTLAEAFRSAGFLTYAAVSTRHLGHVMSGLGQGFQRMSVPISPFIRDAAGTVDAVDSWVREADGQPTFIWMHVFDAHMPYNPPREFRELYWSAPKAAAFDPALPDLGLPRDFDLQEFKGLRDLAYPRALYKGEISHLDNQLRRLLELNELSSAIVAFTADHGESLGHHGIYFDHGDLYPDSLHVPLILSAPGVRAGSRSTRPVQLIDLGRTLLDLAGLEGVDLPGSNLLAPKDSAEEPGPPRFGLSSTGLMASITWNGWHLILRLKPHSRHRYPKVEKHTVELFRLPDDPACERNLLEQELALATRLRSELIRWLQRADDRGWSVAGGIDDKVRDELRALGYAADSSDTPDQEFIDPDCRCRECARFTGDQR